MPPILLDARELATRLGRIPSLRTGRRVVFNRDAVIRSLRAVATENEPAEAGIRAAN